jgi:hypothetical protein
VRGTGLTSRQSAGRQRVWLRCPRSMERGSSRGWGWGGDGDRVERQPALAQPDAAAAFRAAAATAGPYLCVKAAPLAAQHSRVARPWLTLLAFADSALVPFAHLLVTRPSPAPSLQIVYEFLLRYVVSNDTDAKVAKK